MDPEGGDVELDETLKVDPLSAAEGAVLTRLQEHGSEIAGLRDMLQRLQSPGCSLQDVKHLVREAQRMQAGLDLPSSMLTRDSACAAAVLAAPAMPPCSPWLESEPRARRGPAVSLGSSPPAAAVPPMAEAGGLEARGLPPGCSTWQKTSLMIAARHGQADVIARALETSCAQPQLDACDEAGNTPLMIAARWGHLEAVEVLVGAGADLSLENTEGLTAADLAASDEIRAAIRAGEQRVSELVASVFMRGSGSSADPCAGSASGSGSAAAAADLAQMVASVGAEAAALKAASPFGAGADSPGKFVVVHESVPVSEEFSRSSARVATLPRGTVVEVLEIPLRPDDGRVRARLADPPGWISLRFGKDMLLQAGVPVEGLEQARKALAAVATCDDAAARGREILETRPRRALLAGRAGRPGEAAGFLGGADAFRAAPGQAAAGVTPGVRGLRAGDPEDDAGASVRGAHRQGSAVPRRAAAGPVRPGPTRAASALAALGVELSPTQAERGSSRSRSWSRSRSRSE
ncbi:unnamed protein product, partial [Prorocentrum cordatum]